MAKGTYLPIANTAGTGSSAVISFNSFSGYTDLILSANIKTSGNTNFVLYFNSDTNTNYSRTALSGDGSSGFSTRNSNQTGIVTTAEGIGNTSFGTHTIHIMNYSNSTTYKTVISRAANGSTGNDFIIGLWRSINPITSLNLYGVYNFDTASTFTLYGIKAE